MTVLGVVSSVATRRRPGAWVFAAGAVAAALAVGCAGGARLQLDDKAARGRDVAESAGCAGCHGGDDAPATVGPSWNGSWGSEVVLDDGTRVLFDEEFVISSVRTPDLQRRKGDWLHMPAFTAEQISDTELADVIAYLIALGEL